MINIVFNVIACAISSFIFLMIGFALGKSSESTKNKIDIMD